MKLFTVINGLEFNKFTKGQIFFKLTNKNENHNTFQFKDGINVDTNKINSLAISIFNSSKLWI